MKATNLITIALLIFMFVAAGIGISQDYAHDGNSTIGVVSEVISGSCEDVPEETCQEISVSHSGKETFTFSYQTNQDVALGQLNVQKGQQVVLQKTELGDYVFVGPVRHNSLVWLVVIFVILVLAVAGIQGAKSLLSLGVSIIAIFFLFLPGIANGYDPIILALGIIGITLISSMFVIHGFTKKILSASIGIVVSLIVTYILSVIFINAATITGYSSEEAVFILSYASIPINMKAIIASTILLATLGLLDDATITQAGLVFALREENPKMPIDKLFFKAMVVGRDHISSLVNTLVIAYTAASLPMIILIFLAGNSFIDIVNREVIAEEIVRALIGSIGLILAVPITTLAAVFLAKSVNKTEKPILYRR
jgi:uncharacterized membrane protein